jgi:hypothetical protein
MTKLAMAGPAVILSLACLVSPGGLSAEEFSGTNPTLTREVRNSIGASFNPLGLQDVLDVSWKRSLSASQNPLLSEAHVSFGLSQRLTPAYDRLGLWLEVAPLSVLDIRAGVEPVVYFGTFKSLLYFPEYSARFDDDARKARGDEAAAGLAGRAYLSPTFKLRVGSVLLRARADFEWWRARDKGRFFYEPSRDTLLRATGDAMVTGEAVLLREWKQGNGRKLLLGPVYDLTWVYDAPENRRQDVGLVGIWQLGAKGLGLRQPVLMAKVFYYLEDPSKRHEMGAQLAFGFAMGRTGSSR